MRIDVNVHHCFLDVPDDERYGIIYMAINKDTSDVYIGQTRKTLEERKLGHKSDALRKKTKYRFSNAIRKYGFDSFEWHIIRKCRSKGELDSEEKNAISAWRSIQKRVGRSVYNIANGGNGPGTVSQETRDKISKAQIGRKQSPETIKKRVEKTQGLKRTTETKRRQSEAQRGKKHSESSRKKMSESAFNGIKSGRRRMPSRKGIKHTDEWKKAQSERMRGRKTKAPSLETRRKMSDAKRKNPTNYWLGKPRSADTRAKISASLRKRHADGKQSSGLFSGGGGTG